MADDVFQFHWDVYQAGYRWVETRPVPDRRSDPEQFEPEMFLMDPDAETLMRRFYDPLQEHTGLFREFADTAPTQEGILEFANKFGRLGGGIEEGNLLGRGERFRSWVSEIRVMHSAVSMWDMVREGDTKGLSHIIEWDDRNAVRRRLPHSPELPYEIIADWAVSPEFLQ